ncbi:MFS transporter [Kouleothrix sp.]|uniref:MFS transporter n=1 Tax=Kouleothrix sp. TaxID=2779161 RepID=UPI00391B3F15
MFATLRQRNFGLLWTAGLISLAGDWILMIALPIYVLQLTGSTLATSTLLMAGMLPDLLFGSIAGVFVDRWDRKRTMVISNLLLAAGLVPLLLVRSADQLWVLYVVMFFESTIAQFFGPAENALLPLLVDEQHLVAANSLNALNNNLARLLGPAIGGLAAGLVGLAGVAVLDAATFLISAAMIGLIAGSYRASPAPGTTPEHFGSAWAKVAREWLAGLRLIRADRVISIMFGLVAIVSLGEGVFAVLFVVFVNRVLGGGATEIGWLMSAQAVGGLLGGVLVGWIGHRVAPARLLGIGGVLFGLIDLAIFNYPAFLPGFLPAVALFVAVGIPGVVFSAGRSTLLQSAVADAYRGRVFGTYAMAGALMALLGTTLAGTFGDKAGVVTVLNIQGCVYVLAGIIVPGLLGGARRANVLKLPVRS